MSSFPSLPRDPHMMNPLLPPLKRAISPRLCPRVLFFLLLAIALLIARSARADSLNQEMRIDLDAVGDGTVTITDHYSAPAWMEWKDSIGDHPDLVVRDKKHDYAAWEITDISFSKDDVARVAESKMKVRAFAQINKDGEYVLDRLPVGLHLVTNKGDEWIFGGHSEDSDADNPTDLTVHVNLPPGATNAHAVNPDSSHTQLIYSVTRHSASFSPLLLLAVFFGVVGVVVLGLSFTLPETFAESPQFLAIRKVIQPSMLFSGSGKWQLVGRTPEGGSLRLEITDALFASNGNRLVIGRTGELCHVVIDTRSISKQHAQIRRDPTGFKIADRNSSNGTAVNGQFSRAPFDEVPLKEGDTVTMGDVKLDFGKV